jgi:hypothetical protein
MFEIPMHAGSAPLERLQPRIVEKNKRRVTTGHNGDDGRSYFSGFLLRHQRIGTRGHLTRSRRLILWNANATPLCHVQRLWKSNSVRRLSGGVQSAKN